MNTNFEIYIHVFGFKWLEIYDESLVDTLVPASPSHRHFVPVLKSTIWISIHMEKKDKLWYKLKWVRKSEHVLCLCLRLCWCNRQHKHIHAHTLTHIHNYIWLVLIKKSQDCRQWSRLHSNKFHFDRKIVNNQHNFR